MTAEHTPLRWLLIVVIMVGLCLPAIEGVVGFDPTRPIQEKRAPAPPPVAPKTIVELAEFFRGTDQFTNDHFGFRNHFIRTYYSWKVLGLGVSPQRYAERAREGGIRLSYPDVILGKEDWLFYGMHDDPENFRGTQPLFTEEELRRYHDEISRRVAFLQEHGNIPYIIMVAPNKSTVYPELMPDNFTRREGTRRMDQLMEHLKDIPNFRMIDLRPYMAQWKQEGKAPLYHRTDSHWTSFGAHLGFEILTDAIQDYLPEFKGISFDSIEPRREEMATDLAVYIGLQSPDFDPSSPFAEYVDVYYPNHPSCIQDLGAPSWFAPPHSFHYFGRFKNPTMDSPKLLMFHDSFGYALFNFLKESTAEFEHYHWDMIKAPFDSFKPDVVIQVVIERNAILQPPLPIADR